MSSNLLERLRRRVGVRLSLWFVLLFTLSSGALFALTYYLLAAAIQNRERVLLEARLKEAARLYENGGVSAVREWVQNQPPKLQRMFFVRLVNGANSVTLLNVPEDWVTFRDTATALEEYRHETGSVIRIPNDEERDLVLDSTLLADGVLLQIGRATNNRETLLHLLRESFLLVGGATVLLSFLAGNMLAYRTMRPIRRIVATAQAIIRTGQLDARVPVRAAGNELDELARLFNTLLERNEALIRAMREALDNVAHDLRTPLTRLRGTAELALSPHTDPAAAREALADCVEESERVLAMLNTLMDITEAEAGMMKLARERVDLCQLAREVVELYQYVAEERKISVHTELPAQCEANVERNRIRQVLANLLDNAIKYTPGSGRVTITVRDEPGQAVAIFRDTGMGIPAEEQEKIWARLYRSDKSRSQRGLGLGLSLVKAVVEAHGGKVTVSSQANEGATFTVKLPKTGPALSAFT
jgi:signal transduction histidine kinase